MSITFLRTAVTTAGGTPTQYAHVPLLRQLITTWGGTPLAYSVNELLREAITAVGGTPTQRNPTNLLRELVTALTGTPATYDDDALYAQVASLALLNPFPGYAFALRFTDQKYYVGSTRYALLSSVPGYAFTDNVDNLPNIDLSGFASLLAQVSNLRTTINPVTTDQDFIAWVVATFNGAPSTLGLLLNLGATGTNRISFYRDAAGALTVNNVGGAGPSGTKTGQTSSGADRVVILHRRKAGKDTLATKVASTVVIAAESGVVTWPAPTSALQVGVYIDGTLQSNAAIEGAYMKLGAFTDADLTALLAAA